ncbi:MAG: aspartate aminotransferase family protein [Chloroflexota bacterium]
MTTNVEQTIYERYFSRTGQSRQQDARARQFMPGGDTRTSTYFGPYPSYMERGEGCHLYDCDGNQYIDFLNNYTSLIHGHNHPAVVAATYAQLALGTAFASAARVQADLAQIICERVPSIDLVRFTNSGTEATLMAMRTARAYTGKDIIIKMDGGYHGTHDFAEINVMADYQAQDRPRVQIGSPGVPACILDAMRVTRFNDLALTEELLKENEGRVAAVIMEPVLGASGGIPPAPGYLEGMRALTEKYGVLLIFDEIITFRVSLGGMQKLHGVTPDLTALGKIIGGGFAVGAFGGKKEIMERYTPGHPQMIVHAGTFNGHNVTMAAGIATLENYDQAAVDRINGLGDRLRDGFNEAFRAAGIKGRSYGFGSLVMVHWTDNPISTPKDVILSMGAAGDLPRLLHLEMMNRGIFAASRGMYAISTAMTETEIDRAVEAFEATLRLLKPYAAEAAPHLVV